MDVMAVSGRVENEWRGTVGLTWAHHDLWTL